MFRNVLSENKVLEKGWCVSKVTIYLAFQNESGFIFLMDVIVFEHEPQRPSTADAQEIVSRDCHGRADYLGSLEAYKIMAIRPHPFITLPRPLLSSSLP